MLVIVGIVIVFASVVGGYIMEGGHIMALYQPIEVLIIGGAAIGALLVGNTVHVIKGIISQFTAIFGSGYVKKDYQDLLVNNFNVANYYTTEDQISLAKYNPYESISLWQENASTVGEYETTMKDVAYFNWRSK